MSGTTAPVSGGERFRAVLESVALIAASIDAAGVTTFANDYLLEVTGWTREEVVGHDWFERFDDDPDVRRDYFECMNRGEIRERFQSTIRTRAGDIRQVRWSSILERDAEGASLGIVTIGEDVTELMRAEAALRDREEHFRSLIENASDVIVVLALDGTSRYESPAVERVLGWRPDELVGRCNDHLRHPDDAAVAAEAFRRAANGEDGHAVQFRLRHRDGTWRHVEAILRLADDAGEPVVVSNYRDVTERRELQERLLHAQKLEAVGRLAGGVAHDFNNLLTAIGGYAEFLISGFDPQDPRRQDAIEIKTAAARAADLTAQLLAFSRRQVLRPEHLDLGAAVGELEPLLRRLLGPEIELVTSAEPGCIVEADRGQLAQVLTNLTVNAHDAMLQGGRLTIETRRADRDGSPWVELVVTDTGTGMSSETLEHLFEPFYTTKEVSKGTGLGLSTVYGIVAQSGGEVSVASTSSQGTRFLVALPFADGLPVAAALAAPSEAHQAGSETVLVVEDEDTIRRLVRDVLTRSGYTVLDAPDGAAALELLRANEGPVDLILTDVVMPGMGGPELARTATAEQPGLRVLFTSGYTDEPKDLFDEPDAAFIGKPFSPQSLVAKVRELLDAPVREPVRPG